jgi:DNA (cytosine-5)-methyltransferase 1
VPSNRKEIWSFFTGAMGLDIGLEREGLHPTFANEIDNRFCDTIRTNRPSLDLFEGDITNLTGDLVRKRRQFNDEVYMMVGGPPCQSFSSGGKRAALSDPRGNLIYEYFRLISEVSPRYFVFENVANLTTAALKHRPISERPGKHWSLKRYEGDFNREIDGAKPLTEEELSGSALKQIAKDARSLGYHISFAVVDAADYGAPQHRLRFVMLGSRDHPPPVMPSPTHGTDDMPFTTVRETIEHMLEEPGPHSEYTDPVRRFFDLVPEGRNWRSLPSELQKEALGGSFKAGGGKTGFYRRLAWDRPSPTITGRANRKGSALCHPSVSRPISVREAAALQGFPSDWTFTGAMNAQYMQIGNAVPVHLGAAIARAILTHEEIQSDQKGQQPNVEKMIEAAVARLRAAARNKSAGKKAA